MIRQFSAGGVVYQKRGPQTFFLLRKSTPSPHYVAANQWGLPKGWLDDENQGLDPGPMTLGQIRASKDQIQVSALREVHEEAGVEAKLKSRLGDIKFFFFDHHRQRVLKTVIFFLMEYVSDLPQGFGPETSQIKWVTLDEAKTLLKSRPTEYELLVKASLLV